MRPELAQAVGLLRSETPEQVGKAIALLQNTVFSFSMKLCGHREDAEDTMQEVLYRSMRHLARIEDPSALAVWLYTVTRNRCWRMRRKSAQHAKSLSLDELMPAEGEMQHFMRDSAAGPEEHAMGRQEQRLLQEAVLRLPAQLRIVLVLHDMEELETEEVAQVLGIQPGTVRVRLHRARLTLRKDLSGMKRAVKRRGSSASNATRTAGRRGTKPNPACRDLFRNLSEYLDERLESRTCDQMRTHIESCPACVAFIQDLRASIDRCQSMEVPCSSATARRLRNLLTREYLRMLESAEKESA